MSPRANVSSFPTAAVLAVRQDPEDEGELVRRLFKQRVEEERILQRMPKDLAARFQTDEAAPVQAGARPPSALRHTPIANPKSKIE